MSGPLSPPFCRLLLVSSFTPWRCTWLGKVLRWQRERISCHLCTSYTRGCSLFYCVWPVMWIKYVRINKNFQRQLSMQQNLCHSNKVQFRVFYFDANMVCCLPRSRYIFQSLSHTGDCMFSKSYLL